MVEALYVEMPDGELQPERLAGKPVDVGQLPDVDWIKLSQEGLPPVRAGDASSSMARTMPGTVPTWRDPDQDRRGS